MSAATRGTIVVLVVCALAFALLEVALYQRDALKLAKADAEAAQELAERARSDAVACSDGVLALSASAQALSAMLADARVEAWAKAEQHYKAADVILQTPASVPGSVCASAQARVAAVLAARNVRGQ